MSEDFHLQTATITYSQTFSSGLNSPNGTVLFQQGMQFKASSIRKVKVIKASISTYIANVYTLGTHNNGLIRISRDGGLNWTNVQLPNGTYDIDAIEAAINDTCEALSWWIDPADPGFFLEYNLATLFAYVIIDSTKLNAPGVQFAVDFSQSRVSELLGFVDPACITITADGTTIASQLPQIDWVGNSVVCRLHGVGSLTYTNTQSATQFAGSPEICRIPLTDTTSLEHYYPSDGIIGGWMTAQIPTSLNQLQFEFVGVRTDLGVPRPIYILDGSITVVLAIGWD